MKTINLARFAAALAAFFVLTTSTFALGKSTFDKEQDEPVIDVVQVSKAAVVTGAEVMQVAAAKPVVKATPTPPPTPVQPATPDYIYENIPFEPEMQELVWQACEESGCPYELALSVIWKESTYRNVNGDNGRSIGYMQVQPKWHYERMERLGVTDLSDPLSNFRVGCDLLAELLDKYNDVEKALTCYNTGSPGSSGYADRVMRYLANLIAGTLE